jgi:hypothetical protein
MTLRVSGYFKALGATERSRSGRRPPAGPIDQHFRSSVTTRPARLETGVAASHRYPFASPPNACGQAELPRCLLWVIRVARQRLDRRSGRVEKRRGGGRRGELLLPAAFARCRCLSPRHCSVSSSRSSNATCGFPALRSPTGFTWGPRRAHVIGASVRDG